MAKNTKERHNYFCRDCQYATDYHEKNYKGEFFLCKCKFQKRSMFLNKDYCNNFKRRYG